MHDDGDNGPSASASASAPAAAAVAAAKDPTSLSISVDLEHGSSTAADAPPASHGRVEHRMARCNRDGKLCALIGASVSGKATLRNVLAHRPTQNQDVLSTTLRTVAERDRKSRIDSLIASLGLARAAAHTLVGTRPRRRPEAAARRVAYGIRVAMYLRLAVMTGKVWLRLGAEPASIIPISNGLLFGSAFMSFTAVAYVPAFLEDRQRPRASSNVFYRYGFHYWDYQRWVSEDMMVNEFAGRAYACAPCQGKDDIGEGGGACDCMFPIALVDQCLVAG
ncbi:P-loop containing nucleoside triphosphate hydrolase protein [Apiospora kogelbergensis]|uniref:P-loop containing nucleoside triphosphate hydrolase protein n=1 Tax=Apiospora kogelbergensis TaxID=1337665 RepID=A0AAW0QXX5_9PEZI